MKKALLAAVMVAILMMFSACSAGNIPESKILEDMREFLSEEAFEIDAVVVERSRRVEKTDTIDVCVNISKEGVQGERYYTLTYHKYNRVGWQLDVCEPLRQYEWKATSSVTPDYSKETLADYIFVKEETRGGYSLSDNIFNAKFKEWTVGGTTKMDSPSVFIDSVEHSLSEEGTSLRVVAAISAKSDLFQIKETIEFLWNFNANQLEWSSPYISSTDAQVVGGEELNGKYLCTDTGSYDYWDPSPRTVEVKSFGENRSFIFSKSTSKGENTYVIEGLFYAWLRQEHSSTYIKISKNAFRDGPYGWVIFFEDKITDAEKSAKSEKNENQELIIGYTIYEPFAYEDNGLVGFDIDLAKEVCQNMELIPVFKKIIWEDRVTLLNSGQIDCVWNGVVKTTAAMNSMSLSDVYLIHEGMYGGSAITEELVVGFKKGSNLVSEFNAALLTAKQNGVIDNLKVKYNLK